MLGSLARQRRLRGKDLVEKKAFQYIRDMQREQRGLVPARSATVKNESGQPCTTITAQHQQWRRHFTAVLNIQSHYNLDKLESVGQRSLGPQMNDSPTGTGCGQIEEWRKLGHFDRDGKISMQ